MSRRRQSAFRGDVAWHGGATYRVLSNSLSALSSLYLSFSLPPSSPLSLSFRLSAPSHWISLSLSHFTACPCAPLTSLPPPSLRLTSILLSFYPSCISYGPPCRSSTWLTTRRNASLRSGSFGDFVYASPLSSSSSSSYAIYIYTRAYATREKEREGGIRSATFRIAPGRHCVAQRACARRTRSELVLVRARAPEDAENSGHSLARSCFSLVCLFVSRVSVTLF